MKRLITFFLLTFIINSAIFADYEADFQSRADFMVDLVYDYGWIAGDNEYRPAGWDGCTGSGSVMSDFGKYIYPWLIAHYEVDGINALDGSETSRINDLMFNEAHTCPTFHFNLVGLPRIIYQYPEATYLSKSGNLEEYLTRVFERTDSYNAWTVEGTENHVNMSRVPGYLYAKLAVDSGYTSGVFSDASTRMSEMKTWIMTHSKKIYETGVSEWNSTTYGIYNVLSWLSLYDFATDTEVVKAAKAVLDYYACEIALHYNKGITSGGEMRGGYSQKSVNTETDYLAWLWFGDAPKDMVKSNFNSSDARQSVHAAVSSYRPPEIAVKIATKQLDKNTTYLNNKAGYLYEDFGQVNQVLHIGENYKLGTSYTPYGGYGGGDWQIVSWKLVADVADGTNKDAQWASNGLAWGGYVKAQLFRKPFEQFVQHENVVIQITRRPSDHSTIYSDVQSIFNQWETDWQTDFDQRFPTDTDKGNPVSFQSGQANENQTVFTFSDYGTFSSTFEDNILFIEFEKVYLAVRSVNDASPSSLSDKDSYKYTIDNGNDGDLTGLILEVGDEDDFTNFADFKSQVKNNTSLDLSQVGSDKITYTNLNGDVIDVTYNVSGTFTEPIYDWGYGPTNELITHRSPPFTQPDWSSVDQAQMASYTVNGSAVDFGSAVYGGTSFQLDNSILTLDDGVDVYKVDYTGTVPVFTPTFTNNIKNEEDKSLTIYPLPAKDVINLNVDIVDYQIFNIGGSVAAQGNTNDGKINISDLEKGFYIINVRSDKNELTQKLIVE